MSSPVGAIRPLPKGNDKERAERKKNKKNHSSAQSDKQKITNKMKNNNRMTNSHICAYDKQASKH